ncbi:hypothetical protein B0A48_17355 [Cryoendolithus antarcticus]|uniref:Indole-diterpene biosynthesis protein PaxU n=1 Tax=Cryoendolithus antarcticus TaxID=1507870 RepID=A0A1V8SCA4_9PEZI|nr:hypothetical protein B0A48_17355 [Cryoendolithus antarcticus]
MAEITPPFTDFISLADSISYLQHPSPALPQDTVSLIVLCTWMSAPRRPIAKYIAPYRTLYPSAEILVIESSAQEAIVTSHAARRRILQPAVDVIAKHASGPGEPSRTILHAFSNGGGACAALLATMLPSSSRPHAWKATILDSCPSTFQYSTFITAVSLSFPRGGVLGYLSLAAVHILTCIIVININVFGGDLIEGVRATWNDSTVFGKAAPRLYLYSVADELIRYQDVEKHAEDAKAKGYERVEMKKFEGSKHCAHAMTYGKEYWELVGSFIARAL